MNSEQGKRGKWEYQRDQQRNKQFHIKEEPVSKETEKNSKLQFRLNHLGCIVKKFFFDFYHLVDIISKIYNKYARRNLISHFTRPSTKVLIILFITKFFLSLVVNSIYFVSYLTLTLSELSY
ncbi:unnamed protein product [Rhizophagus irregularis]|nr:unnamed protein product [Rhizophagus irregularis]